MIRFVCADNWRKQGQLSSPSTAGKCGALQSSNNHRYRVNLVGRTGAGARDGPAHLDQVLIVILFLYVTPIDMCNQKCTPQHTYNCQWEHNHTKWRTGESCLYCGRWSHVCRRNTGQSCYLSWPVCKAPVATTSITWNGAGIFSISGWASSKNEISHFSHATHAQSRVREVSATARCIRCG